MGGNIDMMKIFRNTLRLLLGTSFNFLLPSLHQNGCIKNVKYVECVAKTPHTIGDYEFWKGDNYTRHCLQAIRRWTGIFRHFK